jgi:hypothetical protein
MKKIWRVGVKIMENNVDKLKFYINSILLVYMPLHVLEEALGNWPLWMKAHHYTPYVISYGQWLAVNIFLYLPLLLIGVGLYRWQPKKFLFAGIAVLVWGFLNALEHIGFTLVDLRWTPGILTASCFGMLSLLGIKSLHNLHVSFPKVIVPSILTAVLFAGLPVMIQIIYGSYFRMAFGR